MTRPLARLLTVPALLLASGCGLVGKVETTTTLTVPTAIPPLTVSPGAQAVYQAVSNGVVAGGTGEQLIVDVGTSTDSGAATTVTRILVVAKDGSNRYLRLVNGSWALPEPVPGSALEGISWNGSRVVLVSTDDPGRFVAVPTDDPEARPVVISPPGKVGFDAIAADGAKLLIVQYADAAGDTTYQIRAIDLPSGVLQEQPVVDKLDGGVKMAGTPVARATTADFIYTVYERDTNPFIHALEANGNYALCHSLPADHDPLARKAWRAVTLDSATAVISNDRLHVSYRMSGGELTKIHYVAPGT